MIGDGHAVGAASDPVLAAKFSPILILTEERGRKWGDILPRVTRTHDPQLSKISRSRGCFQSWLEPFQAAKIGFLAGTALGVTLVDPYRKFTYLYALAGTWVGEQVARELADRMGYPPRESYVAMAFYIGVPAAMAALASEGMRGFHKEPRFSVGLAPDRGGSMSVVATLRF